MIKIFKDCYEYFTAKDTLTIKTKIIMNGSSGYDEINTYQEIWKVIEDSQFNGKITDIMMENSMGWRRRD